MTLKTKPLSGLMLQDKTNFLASKLIISIYFFKLNVIIQGIFSGVPLSGVRISSRILSITDKYRQIILPDVELKP